MTPSRDGASEPAPWSAGIAVFVDTSAFFALLDRGDPAHVDRHFAEQGFTIVGG